jgi:two-component system, response regulator YesN
MTFNDHIYDELNEFHWKTRVEKIKEYVSENFAGHMDVTTVAREMELNKSTLQYIFKRYQQETFRQYVERVRLNKALELLREGKWVKEISIATGYKNRVSFYKAFKRTFQYSPAHFRK